MNAWQDKAREAIADAIHEHAKEVIGKASVNDIEKLKKVKPDEAHARLAERIVHSLCRGNLVKDAPRVRTMVVEAICEYKDGHAVVVDNSPSLSETIFKVLERSKLLREPPRPLYSIQKSH